MKKLIRYTLLLTAGFFLLALVSFNFISAEDFKNIYYANGFKKINTADLVDFNFDQTLSFPETDEIVFKITFGKVYFSTNPGNDFKVRLKSKINKNKNTDLTHYIYKRDHQIIVDLAEAFTEESTPKSEVRITKNSFTIQDALALEISIPQTIKKIHINTVSADWKIKGLDIDNFNLNNVSGDIKINDSRSNEIKVNTVSGDLEVKNLDFNSFNGDSVSGDFEFKKMSSSPLSVAFKTISGEMKGFDQLNVENSPRKLNIKTVSGDLEMKSLE